MNLTKTRNTTKYLAIKEISDENKTYSISALCKFAGIARSAYYKWLSHVNSDNDNLNERIADTIAKIHDEHPDMGYRRIRDTLAHDYKIAVNDKRVLRICRKKKIQSYIKHRYNCCTKPASDSAYVAENILNREFKSDRAAAVETARAASRPGCAGRGVLWPSLSLPSRALYIAQPMLPYIWRGRACL